jgi:hypothetical protein
MSWLEPNSRQAMQADPRGKLSYSPEKDLFYTPWGEVPTNVNDPFPQGKPVTPAMMQEYLNAQNLGGG